jgi:hypothetical protein
MPLRLLAHRRQPISEPASFPDTGIVMFDPRLERSHLALANRLRAQDVALATIDLLVIRAGPGASTLERIEDDRTLRRLVDGVPVLVLSGSMDAAAREPLLARPSWSAPAPIAVNAHDFRQPELRAMLARSRAIFQRSRCHYLLPSEAVHAEAFIRLADALRDPTDLVRVADWILPLLDERGGLAADTGTLLGLLATVRDEARRRFGWDIPIASLDEYPRAAEAVEVIVDNFAATGWESLVFLISVSSTGRVARLVRARRPDARVVVLCDAVYPADENGLGDETFMRHPVRRWPVDVDRRCPQCASHHALYIDPETYEVRTEPEWRQLGIPHDRVEAEKPFWAAVDRTDAVRLHAQRPLSTGAPEQTRHLGVSIDVALLLADADFRETCLAKLRDEFSSPDVVIVPEHAATAALLELAQEAFGDVAGFAIPLGPLAGAALAAVRDATEVLVMDDVLITGATLFGLRKQIYGVAQARQAHIDVSAFVVVSRPATTDQWLAERQRYMGAAPGGGVRHGLHAAQEILLPPPGADHCPWCRERRLLQRLRPYLDGDAAQAADGRIEWLQKTPLEPPLTPGAAARDALTEGAVFDRRLQATAFAAATSTAQHMRHLLRSQGDPNVIQLVNAELMLTAFFDAAIFGGLLRTFDPREVRDPARDPALAARLGDNDYDLAMLYELAFAAAEGKLPAGPVGARLDAHVGDDADVELLRSLARRADVRVEEAPG